MNKQGSFFAIALASVVSIGSLSIAPLMGSDWLSYDVEWKTGFREDGVNWNIANTTGSPNVLSELEWKNLKIWENSLDGRIWICDRIALKFEGDYGKIVSGKNTDKDYGADNRQKLFSLSVNDAGRGEVFDLLGGIGFAFPFETCGVNWSFTPYIGYAAQEQHLRQYNGFQKLYIGANNPFFPIDIDFSGPIDNLHSNYRSRFKGLFSGLDLEGSWNRLFFRISFDLFWSHYRGTGHWNLRDDFANDFIHRGHGRGSKIVLEAAYELTCSVKLGVFAKYNRMRVRNGTDHTFFFVDNGNPIPPGGEVPVIEGITRLNQVNWHSFSAGVTLSYFY